MKWVVLVLCLIVAVDSKYVHRKLKTKEKFIYVTKFCFDTSGPGSLSFTVTSKQADKLSIVTYLDSDNTWPTVYKTGLSCEDKIKKAKSNNSLVSDQPLPFIFADKTRAHLWYFALTNCEGGEVELEYHAQFLQHQSGWNHQFSFDEQHLELTYLLFSIFFFLFFLVHLYGDYQFIRARSFHPIIRLLTISIVFELVSVGSYFLHYAIYSKDGVGNSFLHLVGDVFDYAASLVFMLLLILIAKGWGITHPTISHIQDQKLVLFAILGVFFILYIVLFFWSLFGVDPASSLYLYSTAPGIVFLVVRILTLLYFLWCLQKTFREDSDSTKRTFYIVFGIGYILWFLTLPLIVLVALSLEPWVRMKIVTGIYLLTVTLGYVVIAFLLWPTRAAKYFQVAVPDLLTAQYERL